MDRFYLDHAATTPLSPAAREAMMPYLNDEYGNPSSLHFDGRRSKDAIDRAREALSHALGSLFAEVIFTSSGTESANLALVGATLANPNSSRGRILMGAAEHHCVLHAAPMLRRLGYEVQLVSVDERARVLPSELSKHLADDVFLVSVMHANNELGTINAVRDLADLAHKCGALVHCDAVQTFLRWPWTVDDLGVDLLTVSAHKVNGPKGLGALYIRGGTPINAVALGGSQERELRAGTENVAGIAGFGAAVKCFVATDSKPMVDRFFKTLEVENVPFIRSVDPSTPCLSGHAHIRIPGALAETMLIVLDRLGVSASSGAACSSGSLEPSHVLLACGYSEQEAKEGLRFSFGATSDLEQAEEAARRVATAARQVLRH